MICLHLSGERRDNMSLEKNNNKTRMMVTTALFAALIIMLQLFIVLPPIGAFYITLSLVPIVLGAVLYGPAEGALLGFILGLCVTYQILVKPDPMSALMLQKSAVLTVGLCLLKTTLAGYISGVMYRLISRSNKIIATVTAAAVCPIINTGIFCSSLFLFYGDILNGQAAAAGKASGLAFILAFVIITNFIPELIINVILSPVIVRVTEIVGKSFRK